MVLNCSSLSSEQNFHFLAEKDLVCSVVLCGNVGTSNLFVHFPGGESDDRDLSQLEELIWQSSTPCTDQQIDQFLIISRSATFIASYGFCMVVGLIIEGTNST